MRGGAGRRGGSGPREAGFEATGDIERVVADCGLSGVSAEVEGPAGEDLADPGTGVFEDVGVGAGEVPARADDVIVVRLGGEGVEGGGVRVGGEGVVGWGGEAVELDLEDARDGLDARADEGRVGRDEDGGGDDRQKRICSPRRRGELRARLSAARARWCSAPLGVKAELDSPSPTRSTPKHPATLELTRIAPEKSSSASGRNSTTTSGDAGSDGGGGRNTSAK